MLVEKFGKVSKFLKVNRNRQKKFAESLFTLSNVKN